MEQTTSSRVGCYTFAAEPFHCDFTHQLFMGHLGNHLLNAADKHASQRGFGMDRLLPIHKTWVLSRLTIEMQSMPRENEQFQVETWVESAMRYFTNRNFRILSGDTIYGYGRSIWAMIDTDSRQPADILKIEEGEIMQWVDKDKPCPIQPCSRVKMGQEAPVIRTIDTYYNDVDVNGHINSVKYIEHVLDLFPLSWYERYDIRRFEIAYVAEGHFGDSLRFSIERADGTAVTQWPEAMDEQEVEYHIRIQTQEEVCRSSVRFVAK